MKRRKAISEPKARVWRVSEQAPLGEWVDKRVRVPPKSDGALVLDKHSSWRTSTHDLSIGAEVSEMLGDEFNEHFGQRLNPLILPPTKR